MERDTTIAEAEEKCPYSRGDVLEGKFIKRAVILGRFVNVDSSQLEFKIQLYHTKARAILSEEDLDGMEKVGEREEPYYWTGE